VKWQDKTCLEIEKAGYSSHYGSNAIEGALKVKTIPVSALGCDFLEKEEPTNYFVVLYELIRSHFPVLHAD
jgi:hypothetical protein